MRFSTSANDRKVRSQYGNLSKDRISRQQPQPESGWLHTLGRALRDNAALLAALLALAGVIYTQVVTTNNTQAGLATQRELEEERAREAELQTYFDDMGQMLLDEDNPLSEADSSDPISTLARAKTLAILERSDNLRKRIILQFLHESRLVRKDESIVRLVGANLSDADLSGVVLNRDDLRDADLSNADLSDARLRGADLSDADLSGADLSNAALSRTNLSNADLRDADLSGAVLNRDDLSNADLTDADLSNADLSNADLTDAREVTDEQLDTVWSLEGATMPDGSKHD